MSAFATADERLMQLLADEATEGLSGSGHDELEQELSAHPDVPRDGMELAAAAAALAMMGDNEKELPQQMRAKLRSDASHFFAERWGNTDTGPATVSLAQESQTAPRPANRFSRLGWLAVAASMFLAVVGWWRTMAPTREELVDVQYQHFVRQATDLVQAPWKAKIDDFRGVSGKVVWSDSEQAGYMILSGLPANTGQRQYQLWIVDPQRDARPVDGGVFDVPPDGGTITIPMRARLPVRHPTVFAITLEKEGGVVVSDGPLLVVASVAG
ncbi:MAG TPA: anti-sigma factor [Phycisphaerae bacterium]|nr:anti-sigma factor [Phycisphaerae bacterium]